MAAAGNPGVMPGGFSTGYRNIGAVQKQKLSGTAGNPGVFPGGFTTGYTTIGALQKSEPVAAAGASLILSSDYLWQQHLLLR